MAERLIPWIKSESPHGATSPNFLIDNTYIDHYQHLNNSGGPKILRDERRDFETPGLDVSGFSTSYHRQVFEGDDVVVKTQILPINGNSEHIQQQMIRDGEIVLSQATQRTSNLSLFNPDTFPAFSLKGKVPIASFQNVIRMPGQNSEIVDHTEYLPVFERQRAETLRGKGVGSLEQLQRETDIMIVLARLDIAFGRHFRAGEEVVLDTEAVFDLKNNRGFGEMTFVQKAQSEGSPRSVIQLSRCVFARGTTGERVRFPQDLANKLLAS